MLTTIMPKIKMPDIVHPATTPQSDTWRSVHKGSNSGDALYVPFLITAPNAWLN
jgi:hypothetical protein